MKNRYFADLSNNNQQTMHFGDYVGAGHVLLGHKASEGTAFVDGNYVDRTQRAHTQGSWVLHYHFGHVGESPEQQAKHFWEIIGDHFASRDLPCIDTERGTANESFSARQDAQWTNAFDVAFRKVSGHTIIKYSNESLLRELVNEGLNHKDKRCWIAAYGRRRPFIPGVQTWAWQYTDGVDGPEPHAFAGIGVSDGSRMNVGTFMRLAAKRPPR